MDITKEETPDLSALEVAEEASMPLLKRVARGPISVNCPKIPGESYCWKFENPNPTAHYDFWILVTLQRLGDMMLMSNLIPLSNGELLRFVRYNEYHNVMKSTYIKTIKSKYENYGVVRISRLKAQEYYEGIIHTIFTSNFKVCRLDSNLKPLEPCQTVSAYDFPPLPHGDLTTRDVSLDYRLSQLDLRDLRSQEAIRFPTYEQEPSGEIAVDDGDEYKERGMGKLSIDASLVSRPPGIYVDFADQGGHPSLLVTIFSLVPEDGISQTLFGDYCTEINYHRLHEHVFVKTKRSWFKTKTKITTVRKELRVDAVHCYGI